MSAPKTLRNTCKNMTKPKQQTTHPKHLKPRPKHWNCQTTGQHRTLTEKVETNKTHQTTVSLFIEVRACCWLRVGPMGFGAWQQTGQSGGPTRTIASPEWKNACTNQTHWLPLHQMCGMNKFALPPSVSFHVHTACFKACLHNLVQQKLRKLFLPISAQRWTNVKKTV